MMERVLPFPLEPKIREEWCALEAKSSHPSVFRTPQWIEARAEALGSTATSHAHIWAENDELLAALATTVVRERLHHRIPVGFRIVTNAEAGVGAADHAGWSARDGFDHHVVEWLRRQERTFLLRNLDHHHAEMLGELGVVIELIACPRLDLTHWNGPTKSVAKKNAYYRRRSEREGIRFVRHTPGSVTLAHLDILLRLHDARFGERSVLRKETIAIQKALIQRQETNLSPVVITAEHDGRTVGVLWGLWFAGVFSYYQTGWLPEYKSVSLGTVLVDEAICMARDLQATIFDFLRGPEEYKYRFGASDQFDATVLVPRRLSGDLLALKERIRQRAARRQNDK